MPLQTQKTLYALFENTTKKHFRRQVLWLFFYPLWLGTFVKTFSLSIFVDLFLDILYDFSLMALMQSVLSLCTVFSAEFKCIDDINNINK